jgi:alkyldihydroxyacetonephosphate synthase
MNAVSSSPPSAPSAPSPPATPSTPSTPATASSLAASSPPAAPSAATREALKRLRAALGPEKVLEDESSRAARRHDYWMVSALRDRFGAPAPAPAAVIRPTCVADVQAAVRVAAATQTALIPFGLGSGVVGGVIAGPDALVLDMGAMASVRAIDPVNLLASFDAGMNGLAAEEAVAARGLTIGHWPQSIAVSSVGGWIATRASGQFSTGYGNIEDIVYAIEAVLPDGSVVTLGKGPRASAGPDLRHLMMGSEGALGVITGVTLSLRRAAEARTLVAYAAPDMAAGFEFQRELVQRGWRPPVMRQYDERETRRLHEGARDCTLIMVHEGPAGLVAAEAAAGAALAREHGLAALDPAITEHWLAHRNHVNSWDDVFDRNIVADTVEVSAPWDRIGAIYTAAVAGVRTVAGARVASAHSSHVYRSGLNLYFTFAVERADAAAMEAGYFDAWAAIMRATADGGGSLSHHHGIGRVRRRYLTEEISPEGVALLLRLKHALDPAGVMNPGVLVPDA